MQAACEGSPFLRNNSFFPYLNSMKKHKGRDKGYIYRQTFTAILQLYFLFFYIFMYTSFLASQFAFGYSQCQSRRIWEKQIYKKQEWILPLSILLPKNRFLHRPSISKKQTPSANNTSMTPAISREPHLQITICVKNLKKQKKGTVKMIKAKCEVIVIV